MGYFLQGKYPPEFCTFPIYVRWCVVKKHQKWESAKWESTHGNTESWWWEVTANSPCILNVCSGNLWFFDWVFAGMILSFLKLRQKTFQCIVLIWRIWIGLCAQRILELYSYALHKSTVTIETFVLRWAFCAVFSETVGDACALSCVFRSTWDWMCCESLQQHS